MILQLLTGDLVKIDEIVYPRRLYNHRSYLRKLAPFIKQRLAEELKVHIDQIRLLPQPSTNKEENDESSDEDKKEDEDHLDNEVDEDNEDIKDFPHVDAFVVVLPRPVIDLSTQIRRLDWNFMLGIDLSTCVNKCILEYVRSLPDLPKFRRAQLARNQTLPIPLSSSQSSFPLDTIHLLCNSPGFCANSCDQIVDWLFDHPQYISFPSMLGNSHPRAVKYSCEWLDKNYLGLQNVFDTNPDLNSLYIKYLDMNNNEDMFWYVWDNCPYFCPHLAEDVLKCVSKFPDIQILFRRSREFV